MTIAPLEQDTSETSTEEYIVRGFRRLEREVRNMERDLEHLFRIRQIMLDKDFSKLERRLARIDIVIALLFVTWLLFGIWLILSRTAP